MGNSPFEVQSKQTRIVEPSRTLEGDERVCVLTGWYLESGLEQISAQLVDFLFLLVSGTHSDAERRLLASQD